MDVNEFVMAYKLDKEGVVRDFNSSYTRIYLYLNGLSVDDYMKIPSEIINDVRSNSLKEMQLQRQDALSKAEAQKKHNEELMGKIKELKL